MSLAQRRFVVLSVAGQTAKAAFTLLPATNTRLLWERVAAIWANTCVPQLQKGVFVAPIHFFTFAPQAVKRTSKVTVQNWDSVEDL